ncbi:MAG: NTP transferase domain-containing protein [Opitutaceae bacterium]|nr:NTP transferase domain-containing protein [Opitutaceae bacterium]
MRGREGCQGREGAGAALISARASLTGGRCDRAARNLFYRTEDGVLLGPVTKNSYDLVILAAGMGSRFGGLKQVQPVGPAGELIIEYSIYDAMRAGFGRLVLVIRRDIEAEFRATIGRRLESRMDVAYVFQELDALPPSGGGHPPGRTKPWGTGHAVWAARDAVRGPFAVINADDFYGASGYAALAGHFARTAAGRPAYALVGYPLRQTLSEFGTVSRGLCATDAAGRLRSITEITKIERTASGARYLDAAGAERRLSGDEVVSMNFWGFTPAVFPQLEILLADFLVRQGADPKSEFYLPTAISTLNERGLADVALLRSSDAWFGITYREDLASSQAAVKNLIAAGQYPAPLWGEAQ